MPLLPCVSNIYGATFRERTSTVKKRTVNREGLSSKTTSSPAHSNTSSSPPIITSLTDKLNAWEKLLSDDQDAEFLLEGIENGFKLQDDNAPSTPPPCPHLENYRSTRSKEFRKSVEYTLKTGLRDGLYTRLNNPPPTISPLSAVFKSSGCVRVIHTSP